MSSRSYPARIGTTLIVTSVFASVLCLGVAAVLYWQVAPRVAGGQWLWLPPALLPLLCLPFVVRGYRVDGKTLRVQRLLHESTLELTGLSDVEQRPRAFAGLLRTFGNGGFFSFTGGYWGREIGRATAYATDLGPGLLLRYPTRAVVLTPTEPTALAKALRRASGLPES